MAERHRWTVAAAIVAIIGLLILTASGLCTGLFAFGIFSDFKWDFSSFPSADFWNPSS